MLKIAFISDIHGNLQALKAVLQDIKRQGVDDITVLGDIATLGPNPVEVIEALYDLDATFIRGNHDDLLIKLYKKAYDMNSFSVYEWASRKLKKDHIEFLKAFKKFALQGCDFDGKIVSYHASPWSNTKSIMDFIGTSIGKEMIDAYDCDVFVGGHHHQHFEKKHGVKYILSVGSAGFPYKKLPFYGFPEAHPWSEYAILTLQNRSYQVNLRKIEYDLSAFHKAVTQSDSPIREWLLSVTGIDTK